VPRSHWLRRPTPEFTADSTLNCPNCGQTIHVGTGGESNLEAHRSSKACKATAEQNARNKLKPNKSLHTFFGPRITLNPPTVTPPTPIHAPLIQPSVTKRDKNPPLESSVITCHQNIGSADAVQALQMLHDSIECIPTDYPLADRNHRLASFAGDPQTYVDPELDDWADILSPMFKRSFGWGVDENRENAKEMLQRGEYGLDGFLKFLRYFVNYRGLAVGLFESKVEVLVKELNEKCVRNLALLSQDLQHPP
jgi:hypothetical protein